MKTDCDVWITGHKTRPEEVSETARFLARLGGIRNAFSGGIL